MDWLSSGVMLAWYASAIGVTGACGAAIVCAQQPEWSDRALRLARLLMPVVLLALGARLWLQTWQAFGGDQPLTLGLASIIINDTPWGHGWLWQSAAGILAWVALMFGSSSRPALLALAILGTGATMGLTGHAVTLGSLAWLLPTAHGLHAVAAGLWLGTLAVMMRVTGQSVRQNVSGADDEDDALARVIGRFSPMAIAAVTILASSGVASAWQHLGTPSSLLSSYGFVLIAKIASFGVAALCGFYNWKVVRPALGVDPDAPQQLRSMATLELTFGLVALLLTSILTIMPTPDY